MRSRFKIVDDCNVYFITSSTYCFVPIFFNEKIFKILLNSLVYCQKEKSLKIYGYVIMSNHIHAIIGHNNGNEIPRVMRDFKRYTSKRINEYINKLGRFKNIYWIQPFVNSNKLWQSGYHPEAVITEKFFRDKLDYIHKNPVEKGYVKKPEDWKYSSARNYYLGDDSLIILDKLW